MIIDRTYVVLLREGVADALQQLALVVAVVEQYSVGLLAVASGTSRLLEVSLDGVRAVHVDNQPYVGLVNTHAEGVGGHHDAHLVLLPRFLSLVLVGGVESGVVEGCGDPFVVQQVGHLLRTSATADVDDGRPRYMIQYMQ